MNNGEHQNGDEGTTKEKGGVLWSVITAFVNVTTSKRTALKTSPDGSLVPLTRFELEERLEKRARQWVDTKEDAKEILQKDLESLEEELWNALNEITDKNLLEQLRFENELLNAKRQKDENVDKLHLQCISCGHVAKIDTKAKVQVCAKCRGGSFAVVRPEEAFQLWIKLER